MMKLQTGHGVASVDLQSTIEFHLRNAGFREEVIDEIVDALEWKSEFEKFKEELNIEN